MMPKAAWNPENSAFDVAALYDSLPGTRQYPPKKSTDWKDTLVTW